MQSDPFMLIIQPSTLSWMVAVINGVWRKIFHWQSSGIFPPGDELWLQLPPNPAEHKRAEQGREMAPTALIKLCQLKALYPPFLPREIWNSKFSTSLALQDHGARARRCPTLSLFDQAIFNLSLKSLPLSPPSPSTFCSVGISYIRTICLGKWQIT